MQYLMDIDREQRSGVEGGMVDHLPRQDPSPHLLTLDKIVLVSDVTDLRAGLDTLRTKAIQTFGHVAPHEAYIFMNRSQSLFKLVVHDVMGSWLCTRRLHEGRFHGTGVHTDPQLTADQFKALAFGLPWHRLGEASVFRYS